MLGARRGPLIASNATQVVPRMTDKGGEQEHVCRSDTRGGSAPALGQARWFLCLLSQGTATPQLPENLPQTQPRVSILQGFPSPEAGRALLQGWVASSHPEIPPFPRKSPLSPALRCLFPTLKHPSSFPWGNYCLWCPSQLAQRRGELGGLPKRNRGIPKSPAQHPGGLWVRDARGRSISRGTTEMEHGSGQS